MSVALSHASTPHLPGGGNALAKISEFAEDRTIEGVFAVARKRRLSTRAGRPYLAIELMDSTGRIEGRVWSDVELLDRRFKEGDAVRVLARVEKFRDRLQLDIRSLEPAQAEVASLVPEARRDIEELDGFLDFLAEELVHTSLRAFIEGIVADAPLRQRIRTLPATPDGHHSYSGGLLEHTVAVVTLCRDAADLHKRLRRDLLLSAAIVHDLGRTLELADGPLALPTAEGKLLGHVHLGLRLVEERSGGMEPEVRAELLHAVACHHDPRSARTAEALVLFHANQLDAVAATRPVETT